MHIIHTVMTDRSVGGSRPSARVLGLRHAGISVRDLAVSLPFYRDVLGLEVIYERESDADYLAAVTGMPVTTLAKANLRFPGTDVELELVQWGGVERMSGACRPCDWGSGHICLFVEDIDALAQRMAAAGCPPRVPSALAFRSGPNLGAKALYATDPDGYVVELYEAPRTA
jgi:lactoylglutathione lyase